MPGMKKAHHRAQKIRKVVTWVDCDKCHKLSIRNSALGVKGKRPEKKGGNVELIV